MIPRFVQLLLPTRQSKSIVRPVNSTETSTLPESLSRYVRELDTFTPVLTIGPLPVVGGGSVGVGAGGGGDVAVPLTLKVQFPEPPPYGYTVTVCVPASSVPLHESLLVPPRFVQEEPFTRQSMSRFMPVRLTLTSVLESSLKRQGFSPSPVSDTVCQWQPKTAHLWQLKTAHFLGGDRVRIGRLE